MEQGFRYLFLSFVELQGLELPLVDLVKVSSAEQSKEQRRLRHISIEFDGAGISLSLKWVTFVEVAL